MQPKVSIIVPVYNAGIYFEKCLTSLVNQTLNEIEIIVVLDCPTDGSDKIAEAFAAADSRIKLIYNPQNLHIGLNRNKGMTQTTGKYIGFCDHDDYCDPRMYELLYQKAETENLDIVRCNLCKVKSEKQFVYNYPYKMLADNDNQTITHIIADMNGKFMWNYLYKTEFLRENSIDFPKEKILGEDYLFLVRSVFFAKRLGDVNDCLYFHVYHNNNEYASSSYASMQNIILLNEKLHDFLEQYAIFAKNRDAIVYDMSRNLYTTFRRNLRKLSFKNNYKELAKLKTSSVMIENINYIFPRCFFSLSYLKKPMLILLLLIIKVL